MDAYQKAESRAMHNVSCPAQIRRHRLRRKQLDLLRSFLRQPTNIAPLQKYVSRGGDVNIRHYNTTALCHACRHGLLDAVTYLIDTAGADLRAVDADGLSPLYLAALSGHLGVVKFLLKRGADPNFRCSSTGCTALAAAVLSGSGSCAESLIDAGAGVNSAITATSRFYGIDASLLSMALFIQGNMALVKRLLHAGTLPHPFVPPLDFILLEDPRCPESMIVGLASAGFDVRCGGWISRMVRQLPAELTPRQRNLFAWLSENESEPDSLQRQCRIVIRLRLGRCEAVDGNGGFRERIDRLPLPKILQRYVALENDSFFVGTSDGSAL